ncbi:MAG TPA: DNA polymerase III subunit alpha, partial [Actinomycetota bacterium]
LMMVGTLEDMRGSVEIVFFPQTVRETPAEFLAPDRVVLVKARIDLRDDSPKLMALEVRAPDLSGGATPLRLKMPASSCSPDRLEVLKGVLGNHPGSSPVLLHLESQGRTTVLKLGGGFSVELRSGLYGEIRSVLGVAALVD